MPTGDHFVHITLDGETKLFQRGKTRGEVEAAVIAFVGVGVSYADAVEACEDADMDVYLLEL